MKLLIDIPEHIYEHAKETTEDSRDEFDAMRAIANGTQQESSSEKPNKWIPVSERLPEKYAHTLWCASSGYVRSDYFNGEFWEDAEKYCYEVIAWMPLPKPYRAESEEV